MSGKTLVLRPRLPNKDGKPTWNDAYFVRNALEEIVKGRTITKSAVYLSISKELYLAMEEQELSVSNMDVEVTIPLRNSEARLLWKELERMKPEQFGRTREGLLAVPALGPLYIMLEDIAEQLGEKLPEPDDD